MTVDDVEGDVIEGAIGEAMQNIQVLPMDDECSTSDFQEHHVVT